MVTCGRVWEEVTQCDARLRRADGRGRRAHRWPVGAGVCAGCCRAAGAALRARIGARTGRTSVPAIWVGADYIGGLNDGAPGLLPLDKVGDLDGRLRAAGALP